MLPVTNVSSPRTDSLFPITQTPISLVAIARSILLQDEVEKNRNLEHRKILMTHPAYDSTMKEANKIYSWLHCLRPGSYIISPYSPRQDFDYSLVTVSSNPSLGIQQRRASRKFCLFFPFKIAREGWIDVKNKIYESLEVLLNAHQAVYPAKTPSYYCNWTAIKPAEFLEKFHTDGYVLTHGSKGNALDNVLVFFYKFKDILPEPEPLKHEWVECKSSEPNSPESAYATLKSIVKSPVQQCLVRITENGYVLKGKNIESPTIEGLVEQLFPTQASRQKEIESNPAFDHDSQAITMRLLKSSIGTFALSKGLKPYTYFIHITIQKKGVISRRFRIDDQGYRDSYDKVVAKTLSEFILRSVHIELYYLPQK